MRVLVVRQVLRLDTDMVRFGVRGEANRPDVALSLHQRLQHAVHTIHDSAVAGENDGIGQVAVVDQAGVLGNVPASHRSPKCLIDLLNLGYWHELWLQRLAQCDEAVNVPSYQPCVAGPEVVLLAHERSRRLTRALRNRPRRTQTHPRLSPP